MNIATELCEDCAEEARRMAREAGIDPAPFAGAPTVTQMFARIGLSTKATAITDMMAIVGCLIHPPVNIDEDAA